MSPEASPAAAGGPISRPGVMAMAIGGAGTGRRVSREGCLSVSIGGIRGVFLQDGTAAYIARNLLAAAGNALDADGTPQSVVLAYQALSAAGTVAATIPGAEGDALRSAIEEARCRSVAAGDAIGLDVLDLVAV